MPYGEVVLFMFLEVFGGYLLPKLSPAAFLLGEGFPLLELRIPGSLLIIYNMRKWVLIMLFMNS